MNEKNTIKRIAIACQGGGSHTAFTAGVLKKILSEMKEGNEVVALSGTSGGAICALLAWYGLLHNDRELSVDLLDSFWRDNSANSLWELSLNNWIVTGARIRDYVALPEVSPYTYPTWAQEQLKKLLEKHVNFSEIGELTGSSSPMLLIGAVDVLSGNFKVFSSGEKEITSEAILASTAIPNLFRAVRTGEGTYWDGLFSQNPPVRDLPDAKPDEIWLIQINPDSRTSEPKTVGEILDRRNELAGNLSLNQELFFIEKVNELLDGGVLSSTKYKHIEVEKIKMSEDFDLDYSSKLDRSPYFIRKLISHGERQAEEFLNGIKAG